MIPDRRRKVVSSFVLAHVALFAVAVAWSSSRGPTQAWADQVARGGVFLAEMGLLSIWGGLGRGRWGPRLALVAVLSFAVSCIPLVSPVRTSLWMTLLELLLLGSLTTLVMMLPVVIVLAVVRRLGWRLVAFSSGPPPTGVPLRFSVGHLLALTAVVAGFLSAAYYVRPLARFEGQDLVSPPETSAWNMLLVLGVGVLSFSAAPLLAVWACLVVGRPGLRLLVAGFFCLALGSLAGYCCVAAYGRFASVAVLALAIIAASLLVFRAVGYRLVRHPPEGEAAKRVAGSD